MHQWLWEGGILKWISSLPFQFREVYHSKTFKEEDSRLTSLWQLLMEEGIMLIRLELNKCSNQGLKLRISLHQNQKDLLEPFDSLKLIIFCTNLDKTTFSKSDL